jgi:hypothetical protein
MADSTEPMNVDGDAAMVDEGPVIDVPASGASMEEEKEEDTCRCVCVCAVNRNHVDCTAGVRESVYIVQVACTRRRPLSLSLSLSLSLLVAPTPHERNPCCNAPAYELRMCRAALMLR